MKKLSVIILNWNGLSLLKQLLPGVARDTISEDVDLYVADNGSTDLSVEWVKSHCPDVKLILLDKNYGFAEGYNRAIAEVDTPYVLLLNSDVETTPGWCVPMLAFMESHPEVGAIQPKIRSYHNKEMFEYAGAAGGYLDRLGYPYCRGRLFESVEKDEGQYDGAPVEVAWASGAAMMVRADAYKEVGGLDPLFFAHMEEIDLCCRLISAGYKVMAVTDSVVYHIGGASLNQGNPKKTYLNFRNNLLLLHKNLPKGRGKRILFLRRLADTLAFMMYVVKLDFANAKAILKAHGDFRRMRKNYNALPERDCLSELPGSDHWAVAEHYILRKNKITI